MKSIQILIVTFILNVIPAWGYVVNNNCSTNGSNSFWEKDNSSYPKEIFEMCIYPDGNNIRVEITSFNNDLFDPTKDQPVLRAKSWDAYGINMEQTKTVNEKTFIIVPNIDYLWWPESGKNVFYASFDSGEKSIWVGPVTVTSYGHFKVNILPEEIASIGGWRLNKILTDWYESGVTVEFPSGNKELTFKPVEGWKTPSNYTIRVPVDETGSLTINYQQSYEEYQYAINCAQRVDPLSCTTSNGNNWYYMNKPGEFQKEIFIMNVNCYDSNQCKAIINKIDNSSFSSIGIMYIQEGTGGPEGIELANIGVEEAHQLTIPLPLNEKWPGNEDEIEIYARYEQEFKDVTPWVWTGPITIKRFKPETTKPEIVIYNPAGLYSEGIEVPITGGFVSDNESGLFSVEIQIKNGDVYWHADNKSWAKGSEWNIVHIGKEDISGGYSWYFTGPSSIDDNEELIITAKAIDFAGNSAYTSVTQTKNESNITCNISKSQIIDGEKFKIFGKIDVFNDNLLNIDENILIAITSPDGYTKAIQTILREKPDYEIVFDCDNPFNKKGVWTIKSMWNGNNHYKKAVSEPVSITIENVLTDITIDTNIQRIKLSEPFTISGKISTIIPNTYFGCCGFMPENLPLTITISNSDSSTVTKVYLSTNNDCGNYKYDFKGLNKSGIWNIKVFFNGMETYNASESELNINVVKSSGYAITFLGRKYRSSGINAHKKTVEYVNEILNKNRGISLEDMQYFIPEYDEYIITENHKEPDGYSTKNKLKTAITEWAYTKIKGYPSNLYITMIDHGTSDSKFLCYNDNEDNNDDEIKPDDLKEWLYFLLDKLEEEKIDCKVILTLGFCYSGGFIDELSRENLIIISSASPDEPSYKGPMDPRDDINPGDGIRQGEFFVKEFFSHIGEGFSIRYSFIEASKDAYDWSLKIINNSDRFFKSQNPLLDDDGDGKPSSHDKILLGASDGYLSKNLYIGTGNLKNNSDDVRITKVSNTKFLNADEVTTALTAIVNNRNRVMTSWIEVKGPDFTISNSENNSEQIEMDLPGIVHCAINDGICLWDKLYADDGEHFKCLEGEAESDDIGLFAMPGTYRIYYFVKDNESKHISPLISSIVYKNKQGNSAPEKAKLRFPRQDQTTLTDIMFHWYHSSDLDKDIITYTLMLSKFDDNFSNSDTIIIEGLTDNSHLVKLKAEGHDNWDEKSIFWKVIAVDYYGLTSESETWSFTTNNAANSNNISIIGELYDASSCAMTQPDGISIIIKYDDVEDIITNHIDTNFEHSLFCNTDCQMTVYSDQFLTKVLTLDIPDESCYDNLIVDILLHPKALDFNNNSIIDLKDLLISLKSIANIGDVKVTISDTIKIFNILSSNCKKTNNN